VEASVIGAVLFLARLALAVLAAASIVAAFPLLVAHEATTDVLRWLGKPRGER
jgi:hypothetical protein